MTVLALSAWSQDRTAALTFAFVTHALTMLLILLTGLWASRGRGYRGARFETRCDGESTLPEVRASGRQWPYHRSRDGGARRARSVGRGKLSAPTLERGYTYINSFFLYAYPAARKVIFAPSYPS